jgi:hypothetical protein
MPSIPPARSVGWQRRPRRGMTCPASRRARASMPKRVRRRPRGYPTRRPPQGLLWLKVLVGPVPGCSAIRSPTSLTR